VLDYIPTDTFILVILNVIFVCFVISPEVTNRETLSLWLVVHHELKQSLNI
jgi:hypothetical protein